MFQYGKRAVQQLGQQPKPRKGLYSKTAAIIIWPDSQAIN